MPFLFIILGQKMGIDVTASTALLHVFVKYKDDATGITYNLETTSASNPARDIWYQQIMPMAKEAIANGIYLQRLTKKETLALMTEVLAKYYFQTQEYEKAIVISDIVLEHYEKHISSIVRKGTAYYRLLAKHFLKKYPSPNLIPPSETSYFHYLSNNNLSWFAKAEAFGWREPKREEDDKYLDMVKRNIPTAP